VIIREVIEIVGEMPLNYNHLSRFKFTSYQGYQTQEFT